MKNNDDATTLKTFIERERTYNFLAGLNGEYDQVRIQIFGQTDLSSLNKVISIILAEQSRRGVMLHLKPIEASALVANEGGCGFKRDQLNGDNGKIVPKHIGRDNLWCTFCKKPNHTREMCRKLNGRTPSKEWANKGGQLHRSQGQANMATSHKEEQIHEPKEQKEFNQKEIERLRQFLSTLDKPFISGNCSLIHSGKPLISYAVNASDTCSPDSWIIDFGTTDHMTLFS